MAEQPREPDPLINAIGQVGQLAGLSVSWWIRVLSELQHLPEVLNQLRTGAENFEQVTRQLAGATAALQQMTEFYADALSEVGRRNAEVTELLSKQIQTLSGLTSPEGARDAAGEVQRTLQALARLSPLSLLIPPRPDGESNEDPDD